MRNNLGSILVYAFTWATSPEDYMYWNSLASHWTTLTDPRVIESVLKMHSDSNLTVATDYKESSLYPVFRKLAIYRERFGQDAPIDLMIELVSGNDTN